MTTQNQPKKFSSHSSLSSPLLYSIKKSGLSALLFKNEDRRDFYSLTLQKQNTSQSAQTQNVQSKTKYTHTSHTPTKAQAYQPTMSLQETVFTQSNLSTKQLPSFSQNIAQNLEQQTNLLLSQEINLASQKNKPRPTANSTNNSSLAQGKKNKTLPLDLWPDLWKKAHTRFSLPLVENTNSQVRVAWTYEGLEQDALGIPYKERQEVMKKILFALNHKKGTHTFIPYTLPQDLDPTEQNINTNQSITSLTMHDGASFFWSAMRLVKPRILLVFGSVARDRLDITKLKPLQKIDMGALRILQMHKPETLINDPTHYSATLAFLQNSLRMCSSK